MIPLFKPYMPKLPEIESILYSGALTYGTYTKQFEDKLRDFFATPYLMVTTSFHLAVSVALTTLEIPIGSSVIASPMACLASTQPYLSGGLNICWADVDPTTGTLDPDSVRKQINKGNKSNKSNKNIGAIEANNRANKATETTGAIRATKADKATKAIKAIVHNHFCGYPGYIDEINAIGKEYGIPVIDDGIECFGSEYKGLKIGNCGTDVTIFSLTAVRFCNCIDGGIVIFKDKNLYEKSILIRDCGIDRPHFRDELGEINPNCDISLKGYSATMSNVNGYIGLKQMEKIPELLKKHRKQAEKWNSFFEGQDTYTPIVRENCSPNYWVYGIRTNKANDTHNKIEAIKKFREMEYYASGVHMRNDIYSAFGRQNIELPGVDEFYKNFVALPCGWWMNNERNECYR